MARSSLPRNHDSDPGHLRWQPLVVRRKTMNYEGTWIDAEWEEPLWVCKGNRYLIFK
ncbi:unnamed protein product, partial [Nesidiocoris tenuis]